MWPAVASRPRSRRRSALTLIVVGGMAAGVSLAALTGAVRSATSLHRFVEYYQPENAQLFPTSPALEGPVLDLMRRMNAVPGITGRPLAAFIIGFTPPGTPGTVAIKGTIALADVSFDRNRLLARDRLLAGREANPHRADEAVINEAGAAVLGVHVGSQLPLRMFSPNDASKITNGFSAAPSIGTSVTITGIVRNPVDLTKTVVAQPGTIFAANVTRLELTAAFYQDYGGFIAGRGVTDLVRIRTSAARAEVIRLMAADAATSSAHMVIQDGAGSFPNRHAVQRAVNSEAAVLAVPGALLAIVIILLLGHALADIVLLAAIGVSRRQAARAAVSRALPLVAAISLIAVGVAVALSPLMLFGVSRLAELHPGFAARPALLALGAVGFLLTLTAWVAVDALARHRVRRPSRRRRASWARAWLCRRLVGLTETVAGWGAGPSAPVGVSLAFAPGGSPGQGRGVPVRTAIVGLAISVIGVTAALTYNSSLDHFTDVSSFRGWNWDVAIGNISTTADADAAVRSLTADRQVGTFSGVGFADVRIDGQDQPLLWLTTDHGIVGPSVLSGRLPVVAGEVALASGTMRRAHTRLGGTVQVGTGIRGTSLRVVGEMLAPAVLSDGVRLDTGVVLTHDAATVLGESVFQEPTSFLVRFRSGTRRSTAIATLERAFPGSVVQPTTPADITNVERLAALPFFLAGLLVILGLGALLIALYATVDRRRDQHKALSTIGFSDRQLRDTVLWQAGALSAAAIAIGLPLGAVAGRLAWAATTDAIGVAAPAVVPWSIVVGVIGMFVLSITVALAPGHKAASHR